MKTYTNIRKTDALHQKIHAFDHLVINAGFIGLSLRKTNILIYKSQYKWLSITF